MINENVLILTVDPKYQATIKEALDTELIYKERPYYVEFEYSDNFRLFLPLRSNCKLFNYCIPIINDSNRNNPGIDCSKMLILTIDEAVVYSRRLTKAINTRVYMDIVHKKKRILATLDKTLVDYKKILHKRKLHQDLTKTEIELYQKSTLINYEEFVNNYKPIKEKTITKSSSS